MNRIIIDTDPGVDDALAIAFALSSPLDVIGISTVFGNSSVADSTQNALTIVDLLEKNTPVYAGARRPMNGKSKRASSHGKNGLGGLELKTNRTQQQAGAQKFIVEQLRSANEPIDIVAIGPATNIALIVKNYPDVVAKIGQVVVMAGVIDAAGNITDKAEFNAYNDPLALQIVLSAPMRTVLIPADVCRKVVFTTDVFDRIRNEGMRDAMLKLTAAYITYYQQNDDFETFEGGVMYDLLAVAYILNPTLFTTINSEVRVNLDGGPDYGMTTLGDSKAESLVARDVDASRVKGLFLATLNGTI